MQPPCRARPRRAPTAAPSGARVCNELPHTSKLWARKRLDIAWADLALGAAGLARPGRGGAATAAAAAVARRWSAAGDGLACLSVRSGFDLLLTAVGAPPGSEVLISALTIPDMARLVEAHGLVPVPVDLDPATLGPNPESLRRAAGPRARLLVVAHLFGGRLDLTAAAEAAHRHGLLLVEDCAQAYDGPAWTGSPAAAVSMFSFGTIKTGTALGGALLTVRDRHLRGEMARLQAAWPLQGRGHHAGRLLRGAALKALASPRPYRLLAAACRAAGRDLDAVVAGSARGFPGPALLAALRRHPSAPLLALLDRRLRHHDAARLARRAALGDALLERLQGVVSVPGGACRPHNHWVFPVLSRRPPALVAALRRRGFDATEASSLRVVEPPRRRELEPAAARRLLAGLVFLPLDPDLPPRELDRLAREVAKVEASPG